MRVREGGSTMAKQLKCGELFPGCSVVARGETEEDILRQAAEHAKRDHGVGQIDAATLAKVKAAITPA
jgi:predicted small metal-binding protein